MKRNGFTLLELLVSISILTVVCVTAYYFAITSIRRFSGLTDVVRSLQTVRSVASRISSDVTESSGAVAGSSPLRLDLGGTSYEFRDGKVRRQEGSDVYYLTDAGEVRGLDFSYTANKLILVQIMPKTGGIYQIEVFARN